MERPSREPPESSPLRRRRRRWKGRVLLLGLLAGLFFSVEGKIHLLRLVSLRTLPSGVFLTVENEDYLRSKINKKHHTINLKNKKW